MQYARTQMIGTELKPVGQLQHCLPIELTVLVCTPLYSGVVSANNATFLSRELIRYSAIQTGIGTDFSI